MWSCTLHEGPVVYPFFIGHDATRSDGSITCHPITYDELLKIEAQGARAVFKALQFAFDVP